MKNLIFICLALTVIIFIGGCVVPEESVKGINENNELKKTVLINENQFITKECTVHGTEGGPPQYSLEVTFIDPSKDTFNTISFSVQDPDNNKYNLLKPGSHPATGNHWDGISNNLQSETYFLKTDEMEIVWENIETSGNKFSGEGYINIKKLITRTCPEKMWVGGHYAVKGDSDYFCNIEDDYPPQKIFFKCENQEIF